MTPYATGVAPKKKRGGGGGGVGGEGYGEMEGEGGEGEGGEGSDSEKEGEGGLERDSMIKVRERDAVSPSYLFIYSWGFKSDTVLQTRNAACEKSFRFL